jgi:hypothetical protein
MRQQDVIAEQVPGIHRLFDESGVDQTIDELNG